MLFRFYLEALLLIVLIFVAFQDVKLRIITNKSIGIILSLTLLISNIGVASYIYSILACSIIGFVIFHFNWWAAGDSKLLISVAPLFELLSLPDLFVSIFFCGGLISMFYLFKYRFFLKVSVDEGVPYGLAIVFGTNLSLYFSQGLAIYL